MNTTSSHLRAKLTKRILCLLVSVVMAVGLMPLPAFAGNSLQPAPASENPAFYIKIGGVDTLPEGCDIKDCMQHYSTSYSTFTKDYLKGQYTKADSEWKQVNPDTAYENSNGGGDASFHGFRVQAPEGYVLSNWIITDTAGNKVNDLFKFYMVSTDSAFDANGTRQCLLCLRAYNYYNVTLQDDNTFIVTPVFTKKAGDIDTVNITMDGAFDEVYGGDMVDAAGAHATIAEADKGKYSVSCEQAVDEANYTGSIEGTYTMEPGSTLYYTPAFDAAISEGYLFTDQVSINIDGKAAGTAESGGASVRFQDVLSAPVQGGITSVAFDTDLTGKKTWSAKTEYFGISRNKANPDMSDARTIVLFEIYVNGELMPLTESSFEPPTASGTTTFVPEEWSYTFKAGDAVVWICSAYNLDSGERVGSIQSGNFIVGGGAETDIAKATITLSSASFTFDGTKKAPTVKTATYNGTELVKGTDFTVSYTDSSKKAIKAADIKDAGTYYVCVTGKGNYTGKQYLPFKINPKVIKPTVTLSQKSFAFNSKVQKPTVTVKDGTTKLAASNYTVKYSTGCKNVGTYQVSVALKGNYKAQGGKATTLKFTIVPQATTLSKVTPASKGFTATWKKQATQTTGYQLQYSPSGTFKSGNVNVNVAKNTIVSKKIANLKGNKTYFVHVRTYNSKAKLYSGWSKPLKVTTKK